MSNFYYIFLNHEIFNLFDMFGECLENSSNSRSKNRDQKSGQTPAEKGLAKKPRQVLPKIGTNFKTTIQKQGGAL